MATTVPIHFIIAIVLLCLGAAGRQQCRRSIMPCIRHAGDDGREEATLVCVAAMLAAGVGVWFVVVSTDPLCDDGVGATTVCTRTNFGSHQALPPQQYETNTSQMKRNWP